MIEDEYKIIEECKQGSRSAFKHVFDTYSARLLGVASRYTIDRSEAEDVLQDSFIRVFQTIKNYEGKGSFEGWLRRVVVTTALNHIRTRKARFDDLTNTEIETVEDFSMNIEAEMDGKELLEIIQQLPEGYRVIFNMNVIEGYTHKEIGEKLGISDGTSKSQLSKAKKLLKNILINYKLVA